jgi:hypothetical protein
LGCPDASSQGPDRFAPDPSGRRLVAVYVDANRLGELEEVLRQLDLPLLLAPGPLDPHEQSEDFKSAFQNQEPYFCNQSGELSDITASLSHLSTSDNVDLNPSDLFPARSVFPNNLRILGSPGKKRYYVIMVGKCTGVYWDVW